LRVVLQSWLALSGDLTTARPVSREHLTDVIRPMVSTRLSGLGCVRPDKHQRLRLLVVAHPAWHVHSAAFRLRLQHIDHAETASAPIRGADDDGAITDLRDRAHLSVVGNLGPRADLPGVLHRTRFPSR
jgi:hypothetical protein